MSVKTAVHVYGLTGIVVAGLGAQKDQQGRDVGGPPLAAQRRVADQQLIKPDLKSLAAVIALANAALRCRS